ncbi:hypothetical protein [Rhodophyticola sp. CCM32]|nr:hypothetical protein [Rhodophyticola sp. CCM32]
MTWIKAFLTRQIFAYMLSGHPAGPRPRTPGSDAAFQKAALLMPVQYWQA